MNELYKFEIYWMERKLLTPGEKKLYDLYQIVDRSSENKFEHYLKKILGIIKISEKIYAPPAISELE